MGDFEKSQGGLDSVSRAAPHSNHQTSPSFHFSGKLKPAIEKKTTAIKYVSSLKELINRITRIAINPLAGIFRTFS